MAKPSRAALENEEEFDQFEVKVPVYRSKADGNLYFIDETDDRVLDRYITVRDSGGLALVTRRRSGAEKLGSTLLRGAVAVLASSKLDMPLGVARVLLNVAKEDAFAAAKIRAAFDLAKAGEKHRAGFLLVDAVGPDNWRVAVEAWTTVIGDMTVSDFLAELESEEIGLP